MPESATLGHFNLLEEIAHGGMGTIYRAFDPTLNREVAIKVLREQFAQDPRFLEEFLREARNAAAISHPHIVQVYFVGEHAGQYYIVMELLRGRNLRQLIEQDGPLTEEAALDIVIQVAEALRAAYKNQMIHGDIKPANIFVTEDVGAKVLDFGLAKLANVEVTGQGEIWGSPYYMSPERVGQKAEDFRSDIYSLGATLFHALTGRPPFDAEKLEELAAKRLSEKPPLLRDLDPRLTETTERVVNKMLNKSPLLRYRDYSHLLEDLREAKTAATAQRLGVSLQVEPVPGPPPPEPVVPPPATRSPWPVVIGVAAGVVVLGVAALFLFRRSAPTEPVVPPAPPAPETVAPAPPPPVESQPAKPSAEELAQQAAEEVRQQAELARRQEEKLRKAQEEEAAALRPQRERAAVEQAIAASKAAWDNYDFRSIYTRYQNLAGQLQTPAAREALQPQLTTARWALAFKDQLIADFSRRSYDQGDVQTRQGVLLPGRVTRATDQSLTLLTPYTQSEVAWSRLLPTVLTNMAAFYRDTVATTATPADRARRHLQTATFCHVSRWTEAAAFHATEALRLDPTLHADVIAIFGKVPTYTPPKPAPTPQPQPVKPQKFKSEFKRS